MLSGSIAFVDGDDGVLNVVESLGDDLRVGFHLVGFANVYQGLTLLHKKVLLAANVDDLLRFELV